MPHVRLNAGAPQAANWKMMRFWRHAISQGLPGEPSLDEVIAKQMPFSRYIHEVPKIKKVYKTRKVGGKKVRVPGVPPKLEIQGGPHFRLTPPHLYLSTPDKKTGKRKTLKMSKLSILTWTSKMSCASFSLPAGVPGMLGTCAAASKTAVLADGSYADYHASIRGLRPLQYVCEICYAGKGNYQTYPSVNVGQVGRMFWLQYGLLDGWFSTDMAAAIESLELPEARAAMARLNIEHDYFRIHDSGDFFDTRRSSLFQGEDGKPLPGVTGFEYYDAWVDIARYLPHVKFWAPTRMWVFSDWRDHFRNNPPPPNMALRPSTLVVNQTIEDFEVPYMNAASSVYPKETDPKKLEEQRVYNCPAYTTDGKTCIEAEGPAQEPGCRACWVYKDLKVNYSEH